MLANGCSPEVADLIEALDELMNTRYASRREFVEALFEPAARCGVLAESAAATETVTEKMFSEQLGSRNPRYNRGPNWKVAKLIVDHCSPGGRWIVELARIAAPWARAHDLARPLNYSGPIFPATTAEAPATHLDALVEGFPLSPATVEPCPNQRGAMPEFARQSDGECFR
jgi:hypothetical protein